MGLYIRCCKLMKSARTLEDKRDRIECVFDTDTKRYTDWDFPEWARAYKRTVTETVDAYIPNWKITINCIYLKQVGCQRNGLNDAFYADSEDGKIGDYVWTLADLERCKNEYCDTEQQKRNFQTNIIDKFKEGKCVVMFSW